MAEIEVAKNLKKAIIIAKDKNKSLSHKIKHVFFEVCIIIFAVTLSISFHSWSEHRHDQKEVSEFLKGLNDDLHKDIKEMQTDIEAYEYQKNLFKYISEIPNGKNADKDSIENFKNYLFNYTGYGKNSGRYEGFKSSGKLYFIEDHRLQNDILDYYEEEIALLNISTTFYKDQKIKFSDFIINNASDYPEGNFLEIISSPKIKNRSKIYLSAVNGIILSYKKCIQKAEEISNIIEKEYH